MNKLFANYQLWRINYQFWVYLLRNRRISLSLSIIVVFNVVTNMPRHGLIMMSSCHGATVKPKRYGGKFKLTTRS